MNTLEIYKIAMVQIPNFKGVYPIDKLPNLIDLTQGSSIIVNTHTHNLAGEHWIAVYVSVSHVLIFDPLGIFYPRLLVNRLRNIGKPIKFNKVMIQNPRDTSCGHYSLLWLATINRGR